MELWKKKLPILKKIAPFFVAVMVTLFGTSMFLRAEVEDVSVSIRWNGSGTNGTVSGNSAELTPTSSAKLTLTYQVTVANHKGDIYAPGEIQIELPRYLYNYRNAASISSGDFGRGQGVDIAMIGLVKDGETPSAMVPFTYKTEGDKLIVTNALEFAGASNAMFQVVYEIEPLKTVDGTTGTIQADYSVKGQTAKSETLDAVVHTSLAANTVTKTVAQQMGSWNTRLGEKPADYDDYHYFWFRIRGSLSGTQPYQFVYEDDPAGNGQVVGYYDSYSGSVYEKSDTDTFISPHYYPTTRTIDSKDKATDFYVLVRYPKADGNSFENTIKLHAKGIDGDVSEVITDTETAVASDMNFTYKGDLFAITKAESSDIISTDVAIQLLKGGTDTSIGSFVVNGEARAYQNGKEFVMEVQDDFLDIRSISTTYAAMSEKDYYFDSVKVQLTDMEVDDQSGDEFERSGSEYSADVYAQVAGSEEWIHVSSIAAGSTATYTLPENTIHVKTVYDKANYYAKITMTPWVVLRSDSELVQELLASEPEDMFVRNYASLKVNDKESGALLNGVEESNYISFDDAYKAFVMERDREYYGHLIQRDTAEKGFKNGYMTTLGKAIVNSTTTNTAERYVDVKYRVGGVEYLQLGTLQQTQAAINTGLLPDRKEGMLYALLPEGMSFVSLDKVTGSASPSTLASDVAAQAKDLQIIPNYKGSNRTMIIVHAEYTGNDIGGNFVARWDNPTNFAITGFTMELTGRVTYDDIAEYGNAVNIHSAYQAVGDDEELFYFSRTTIYPDNGQGAQLGVRDYFYNLREKEIVDTTKKNTVYGYANRSLTIALSTGNGMLKTVRGINDNAYDLETTIEAGDDYIYRLQIRNGEDENGDLGERKDVILYDRIENTDQTNDWEGTFQSIDISQAVAKGIDAVVYYSTNANAVFDITDAAWSTTAPANLADVKAVAVDLSRDTDGDEYIFEANSAVSVYIHMSSPDDKKNYTYNQGTVTSKFFAGVSSDWEDKTNTTSNTAVKIAGEEDLIVVDYVWVGDDYPSDVTPPVDDEILPGTFYVSKPQEDTQEDYIFDGWYTDEECTIKYTNGTQLFEDTTLYGRWIKPIKVEYEWVGTVEPEDVTPPDMDIIDPGTYYNAKEQELSTVHDYEFNGWYRDEELTQPFTNGTQLFEDTVLYGEWIPKITVTYEWVGDDNPSDVIPPDPDRISKGSEYDSKPQEDTEEDYIFDGWYRDEDLTVPYEDGTVIEEDTTLYGKWSKPKVRVDYVWVSIDNPSDVTPPDEDVMDKGTNYTSTPQDPSAQGYIFFGWYLDEDLEIPYIDGMMIIQDTTLYGRWEKGVDPVKEISDSSDTAEGEKVSVGDQITYKITYTNFDTKTVTVTIKDVLDKGLDYVSSTDGGVYDEGSRTVTWTLGDVTSGTEGYVELTVQVNDDAVVMVENEAVVQIGDFPEVTTDPVRNPLDPQKDYHEDSEIQKDDSVAVTQQIIYEIFYGNYEDSEAEIVITDKLDEGVDFISASDGGSYDASTHKVTWTLTDVPAGEKGSVVLTVEVNEDAQEVVENSAKVKVGSNPEIETNKLVNPLDNEEPDQPEKDYDANSEIQEDDHVQVGDQVIYRITYKNTEDSAAKVVITDKLDEGFDFIEASDNGVYDEGTHTVTWTFDSVAAGADGYVLLTVEVNKDAVVEVENQATVKVGDNPAVDTGKLVNPVDPSKTYDEDSEAGKDDEVRVGDRIAYDITYGNNTDTKADVIITDKLDDGVDFITASDGGSYNTATHTVTWTISDVEPGEGGYVKLVVEVNEDAVTIVENKATVQVGNEPKVDTNTLTNPVDPEEPDQPKKDYDADSEIQEDDHVQVGDQVVYQITYKNTEDSAAKVVITDKLDEGFDFIEASDNGVYDESTHTVTWTIDSVEAGADGFVVLTVEVNKDAVVEVENQATVKVGDNPAVDTGKLVNPVDPSKTYDEDSETGKDDEVKVGDQITYDITYGNNTDAKADIVITDKLDDGVDFITASDGGSYNTATHTVTWTISDVEPGEGGYVKLVVEVNEDAVTIVENKATVQVGNEPKVDTNTLTNPVDPEEPDQPKKDYDADSEIQEDDHVQVGDQVVYRITYQNTEDSAAKVVITDKLDEGFDFIEASHNGVYDEGTHTVTWTFDSVAAGADGFVLLTVEVNKDAVVEVENQATVKVGDNPAVDTGKLVNPVDPSKTYDEDSETGKDDEVRVGDRIAYDITYGNNTDTKADVIITDKLDDGVDFITASDGGSYNTVTHTVTWTISDVEPGEGGYVKLVVEVNEDAVTIVDNKATVQVGNEPKVDTNTVTNPVDPEEPDQPKKDYDADSEIQEDDHVQVGDQVIYRITYKNTEDSAAKVVITDKLDSGFDFIEASDGGVYDESTHTVTWTFDNVAAGADGFVVLTVEVNKDAVVEVENQATVKVGDNPAVDTGKLVNPVDPSKDYDDESEIGKGEEVKVGDQITYDITYGNNTDAKADIVITDKLDDGVDFITASDGGSYNTATHTVTWTISDVEPGEGGYVKLVVEVNEDAVTIVENKATVQVGNEPKVDTNTLTNPVDPEEPEYPGKEYDKTSEIQEEDHVQVGDQIIYRITYKNTEESAVKVVITDKLDEGFDFIEASDNGVYDESTHTVTWTFDSVEAGKEGYVLLTVEVNKDAVVEVENQATVKVGDNPAVDTGKLVNPVDPSKTYDEDSETGKDDEVRVGDRIAYDITYGNNTDTKADVIITDKLDDGVDFITASDGGSYNTATHTVTWTISDVEPGEGGYVKLVVEVNEDAVTIVENKATVQVGNEPKVDTNTLTNPVDPEEPDQPKKDYDADSEIQEDDHVQVGDQVIYRITYKNTEDSAAKVVITDKLDEGFDFIEASDNGVYDESTHTVTWTIDSVEAGADGFVVLTVEVNKDAVVEVENQATVKVGDNPAVDTGKLVNPVDPSKAYDEDSETGKDDEVKVGDQITYDITYGNNTDAKADIVITDKLDDGVDFISASDGGSYNTATHTVTWTISDVEAGEGGYVKLVVEVNEDAVTIVENKATVQVGNEPKVDTNTLINPVDPEEPDQPKKDYDADSEIQKDDHVQVGDQVVYRITYKNTEDSAVKVVITDKLDEGFDFIEASDGGVYDEGTHTVTWTFDSVEAGADGYVLLTVEVNKDAVVEVENQATVKVGDNPAVDTGKLVNPVDPSKTYDEDSETGKDDEVKVGDRIAYNITYGNNTDAKADVIITDKLDDGVDFITASDGASYNTVTHTVTWTISDVEPGDGGYVKLVVEVNEDAVTVVENKATVQVGNEPKVDTNTVTNPVDPEEPEYPGKEYDQTSEIQEEDHVQVGEQVVYRITYKNTEDSAAKVVITDKLDEGFDFIEASDNGVYDEGTHTVTWTFDSVEAGADGYVLLTVEVNKDAVVEVENQATVKVGDNPIVDTGKLVNPVDPGKTYDESSETGKDDEVKVGDQITYDITYGNNTDAKADVIITDKLDKGVDFINASDGASYDASTHTVTWTISDVEPGEGGYVKLVVIVNEDAVTVVENKATVQVGNEPKVDTNTVTNPVDPNPEEPEEPRKDYNENSETQQADTVKSGDSIIYDIYYENGENNDVDVIITDVLDPGVDFISATDGGSYDAKTHTVTWTLTGVASREKGFVSLTVIVNDTAVESVENSAMVKVGNNPEVKTNKLTNPVDPEEPAEPKEPTKDYADKSLIQEGSVVKPGDEIVYQINFTNFEKSAADIIITDKLDKGLTFIGASNNGNYDADTHTVSWKLTSIAPGAEGSVELHVSVNSQAKQTVDNVASVQVGDNPAINTNILSNPLDPEDPDQPQPENPEKSYNSSTPAGMDGAMVVIGDYIIYDISYFNHEDDAADIIITDTLDPGVNFASANNGGTYDAGGHTAVWNLSSVPAGARGLVTVVVKVNTSALTQVDNVARVKVGNNPEVTTNILTNPLEPPVTPPEPGQPEKSYDPSSAAGIGGAEVEVGDFITYNIHYHNFEEEEAAVIIRDTLDVGLNFISASDNGIYDPATRTIIWTLDKVDADTYGTVTLTVEVNADAVKKVENVGYVQVGDNAEVETNMLRNPVDSEEEPTIDPKDPKEPEKSYDTSSSSGKDGAEVTVNSSITYRISYFNHETEAVTVAIRDALDRGVDFVSASHGGSYDESSHTVTWNIANVPGNAQGYVTLTVDVNTSAVEQVENTAYVAIGNNPEVKTNKLVNPLKPSPEIPKTNDPRDPKKLYNSQSESGKDGTKVKAGNSITYDIQFYNHENEAVTVIITDTLDRGVDYVSSTDGGVYDPATHTVTWILENVDADYEGTVSVTVKVNDKAVKQVENTAIVKIGSNPETITNKLVNPIENELIETDPPKTDPPKTDPKDTSDPKGSGKTNTQTGSGSSKAAQKTASSVKTGDESNISLMLVILGLSALTAAAVITVNVRKRRKTTK